MPENGLYPVDGGGGGSGGNDDSKET